MIDIQIFTPTQYIIVDILKLSVGIKSVSSTLIAFYLF